MFGNIVIDSSANNMYLISNPFIGGPIPILNQLPNGFHVIFLTVAVTFGYAIVYFIAGFAVAKRKPIETIKRKA
jgi:hypothetical protein